MLILHYSGLRTKKTSIFPIILTEAACDGLSFFKAIKPENASSDVKIKIRPLTRMHFTIAKTASRPALRSLGLRRMYPGAVAFLGCVLITV